MKNPQVSWTVFSLCRSSDKDREPKFWRVCAENHAKGIIADLDDEDKLSLERTLPLIKKLLVANLKNKQFDYIFTHGANGEYGHPRHIGVHKSVKNLISTGLLKPEAVFYFNYKKTGRKEFAPFEKKADTNCILNLSKEELRKKREIVAYMYGYDINGIDVSYCTNPEAFIKKNY